MPDIWNWVAMSYRIRIVVVNFALQVSDFWCLSLRKCMFMVEINADYERADEKLATCHILLEYKPPASVSSTIIFGMTPRVYSRPILY